MRFVGFLALLFGACGSSGQAPNDSGGGGGDGTTVHKDARSDDGAVAPSSNVTIIVEPSSTRGAELTSAISAAQQSVYMTMYQIDNSDVIAALVARAKAGIDVQVVLDSSTTCKSWNTPAYNSLTTAGAKVVWSNPTFTFTHEKTVIIDGTTAWIMTMNLNTSPPEDNREYLAIDTDPGDVAEATAVFKADHALQSISPTGTLVVANYDARVRLVDLIDSATSTLDIEVEEFSDLDQGGIVDAVDSAAARHVAVRIIVANGAGSSSQTTAINRVKAAGAKVVVTGPASSSGTMSNPYIHAKAITVDCAGTTCAKGFVGSENFSAGSLGYNRELGVIFDVPAELAKVEAAISTDFSNGTAQ